MSYENAVLTSEDWVPRFEDAGFDDLVKSVAPNSYKGNVLLTELNESNGLSYCTWEMLAKYLADRQEAGALLGIAIMDGPDAIPETRYDAPAGIGADSVSVWFSTPDTGTEYVRWYVNGELKISRQQDLASNRSATLAELGAEAGDVIQVCIEAGGVVGWWARITV